MKTAMTRNEWLHRLHETCEPVGDCLEWQGPTLKGKTPLVYVPKGFVLPEWGQHRQSARVVMWVLHHGNRPPAGSILRPRCLNDRCVAVEHMGILPRSKQAIEQSKRGEFCTPERHAAAINRARSRKTKLSIELAREIRASSEPARALAPRHGVSRATITAVRRGVLWPEVTNGASIFSWRPA